MSTPNNEFEEIAHRENKDEYQNPRQPIILYLNHKIVSLETENNELKQESLLNSSKK